MGFTLRTGAGVAPRAKTTPTLQHMEPANMTPALGGKQHAGPILSRPRPSEMNVLAPHRLILLIHPFTPARFRFPSSQTHFVTHELLGSKPNKFTALHVWLCLTDVGPLAMCAFDRDIRWKDSARSRRIRRSKIWGVDDTRGRARWEDMKRNISERRTDGARTCALV